MEQKFETNNIFSQFEETLNTPIEIDSLNNEFEPQECEVKKMTILMDFDETTKNKSASVENLLDHSDVRISLASMSSMCSEESRYSSRIRSTVNENSDYDSIKPSLLAVEALRHYQKYHYKNFNQSQIEETIYLPGIILSAERVVRMLAKILCIGTDPDKNGTCYQPSIFVCSSKTPFFFELFSRTMWLLSKTRREMKASTIQDYEKVIYILGKQVKMVLEKKVLDFKKLTEEFCLANYHKVMENWQKEKDKELENTLKENPSVQILKKSFTEINIKVVYEQRLKYIKAGTLFPKFNDKKINGNFFAKLSNDNRSLLINDYNVSSKMKGDIQSYLIADIAYIVENKACPHVRNNSVKDPSLAFSILLKNDTWINFKAADRKSAAYWLDALNYLLDKGNNRSKYFDTELDELVKMDLVLYLIELQTVPIPKRAPPIPKLPFEVKPLVPPKPRHLPIKK